MVGWNVSLTFAFQVDDSWEAVRVLDDAEKWAERNRVLSKADHSELIHYAQVEIMYGSL